jgi:hypothetical protein
MKLRHTVTGVQVLVPNDKAVRLIASGDYEALPDAEQPPPGTGERKPVPEGKQGPTSIYAAIAQAVPGYAAQVYEAGLK